MPILNRAAEMQDEIAGWRHALHMMPELQYDVEATAAFVAAHLRDFGCDEVVEGLGRTGVVGVIRGRLDDGPTIGLRADMDALPMTETTGKPWASKNPGKMHACGHDGHMAMLLGAARCLAETRNFAGSVAVIFQPAEEGGGGGRAMLRDGLMERFAIAQVYGMHNMPGLPLGEFATRPGALMAGTSEFTITITGRGGHAASPQLTIDPIVVGSALVQSLQTIASRSADPIASVVVSVTKFHAGDAYNVIPQSAEIAGTVRMLDVEVGRMAEARMRSICEGMAAAHGAGIHLDFQWNYPVTVNHVEETRFAVDIARQVAGDHKVNPSTPPFMGGEDFSYMLQARPGALIFLGNGDTAGLHNPAYDFNDEAIPLGVSYWVRLAEAALAR